MPELEEQSAPGEVLYTEDKQSVYVVSPDGTTGTVPVAEYDNAVNQMGFRPQSEQEVVSGYARKHMSGLGSAATAFAEGTTAVLPGLTHAIGEVAGPEYQVARKMRAEQNPLSAMAGQIAPSILPIGRLGALGKLGQAGKAATVVPRATGALAKGAQATATKALGKGLAGRTTGSAAAGALEGGAFGGLQYIHESAVRGDELTAEKLLSAITQGGLAGGVLGGALPVVGAGFKGAAKLTGQSGKAREMYQRLLMDSIGATGGARVKLVSKGGGKVLDDLDSYVLKTGDDAGKKLVSTVSTPGSVAPKIKQAFEEVGEEFGSTYREIFKRTGADKAKVDIVDFAKDLAKEHKRLKSGTDLDKKLASTLKKQFEVFNRKAVEGGDGTMALEPLLKLRQEIGKSVYARAKDANGNIKEHFKTAVKYERKLEAKVESKIEELLGSGDLEKYKAAKSKYESFAELSTVADATIRKEMKSTYGGLTSQLAGGMGFVAGTAMGGIPGGIAGAVVGSALKGVALPRAASSIVSMVRPFASRVSTVDGKIAGAVERISSKPSASSAAAKAAGMVSGTKHRSEERKKDIRSAAAQATAIINDPTVAASIVASALGEAANEYPMLAKAMEQRLIASAELLAANAPSIMSRSSHSLTPSLEGDRLSPMEANRFNKYLDGIRDMAGTLDMIANGKVPRERIEALKKVYPKVFEDVRSRVMSKIAELKEPLPYTRRVQLGLVFDFESDKSLTPESMGTIQGSIQSSSMKQEESKPGPKRTKGGITQDASAEMLTEAQKLQG